MGIIYDIDYTETSIFHGLIYLFLFHKHME